MKMLKVTTPEGMVMYINPAKIEFFYENEEGFTTIVCQHQPVLDVQESVDQILDMLRQA